MVVKLALCAKLTQRTCQWYSMYKHGLLPGSAELTKHTEVAESICLTKEDLPFKLDVACNACTTWLLELSDLAKPDETLMQLRRQHCLDQHTW